MPDDASSLTFDRPLCKAHSCPPSHSVNRTNLTIFVEPHVIRHVSIRVHVRRGDGGIVPVVIAGPHCLDDVSRRKAARASPFSTIVCTSSVAIASRLAIVVGFGWSDRVFGVESRLTTLEIFVEVDQE